MVLKFWFLLVIVIIIISSPSSFGSLEEVQLNETQGQSNGYLSSTILLPNSIGIINGQNYENVDFGKLAQKGGSGRFNGTSKHFVNVDHFGAKGDGHDDSEAFTKAWGEACSWENAIFIVPRKRVYHLKPITFSGPCRSNLKMKIHGKLIASAKRSDYVNSTRLWIVFENIEDFVVEGGGIINGNGKIWWRNSCKINRTLPCTHAPTAVTFYDCTKLRVRNIRIKNAQQMQLSFQRCVNVKASRLRVNAPDESPNTDGIHVTATHNIKIFDSIIRTGDDCISIVSGSKDVEVKDVICGPGHGISIGSLGKGNSEDHVSDVLVDGALFEGTDNGVRIKTWQGGYGYAKNIKFQNIEMYNVRNPVIIDQNYCDRKEACYEQHSAVQVKNVEYKNIQGTSATQKAINIGCSKTFPCQGILFNNVKLLPHGGGGGDGHNFVEASCHNIVKLQTKGGVSPHCNISS